MTHTLMPPSIFISAGEASGDTYGAQLITAARRAGTPHGFFGLGGDQMRSAGCEIVTASREVAVVGLFEVVNHLPGIYGKFHRLLREIDQRKPAAAVLIDFPDFNLRLAKQLHRRGIPVIYFVSPQVWAAWDVLPTLAEIAGVKAPADSDGLSMRQALQGRAVAGHEYLYWEFHEGGFKQAVRWGTWKGVRLAPGQPLELYDLARDMAETTNVAARHPPIVARIESILKSARSPSEHWPDSTPAQEPAH